LLNSESTLATLLHKAAEEAANEKANLVQELEKLTNITNAHEVLIDEIFSRQKKSQEKLKRIAEILLEE
jgi:hypothetical protein